MSPLPLLKLGTLVVKQLSKPLANAIKSTVKENPRFAKTVALPAQAFHIMEQRVRMAGFGWKNKVEVKPLNEDAAVSLGAEMVGEFVIFSLAAICVILQVVYSKRSEKRKEEALNNKLVSLQEQILQLNVEKSEFKQEISNLKESILLLKSVKVELNST
ncbi:optic atrophy 3 protein homolog [Hydra vulgaris]|uniref:Optic atrophy 3 protein homolog n=1 Tax=Hydra vulgaris TaxID=6087 RepID=A0ABM4CJ66_HYDVU